MSKKIRKQAKKLDVDYSFLFMHANGKQLAQISSLLEAGAIRPVIDKVFPFGQTNDALSYVGTGRAKGKVIVDVQS